MRYLVTVAACLVGTSAALLAAQQAPRPAGAAGRPSTTVDFIAVDAKGQPVTTLTAADVAIRIDGKAREVRDLRLVRHDPPTPLGMEAPEPLPAPFASNAAGNQRRVFIIVDNETMTTGREQRVRDGVLALINQLGPGDEVAIVTVPRGGVATELTSDRAALRRAVGQLAGARAISETADEAACRSRLTVEAVTNLLAQRAGGGTPIEVVFVSSHLSGPRSNVLSGATSLGRGSVGGCELPSEEFTKLGAAAAAARAHLYIVQPESVGTATASSAADTLAGLENVASVTGGFIWHMAGSDEPGFQRVAAETSAYYSATVDLDSSDRSSATRPLSVKTTKADVVLRARPTIALGPAAFGVAASSPKDMLRTATVYRDAPLRVAAFASRNPGDSKVKIVAIAESTMGATFSAASIGVYDTSNKLIAQWSADGPALAAPFLATAFVQNAGQYRVRVAATDSTGRGGTADYPLNATLTPAAGTLTLSAMMLGTPDNNFTPKLQFTTEPTAVAYFELYGGKPGMPVSVAVELATTLNGPAAATLQPKIAASSEPDKYLITVPINLSALPVGDYIVRAIVGLDGQPAGRITRTLRKTQ